MALTNIAITEAPQVWVGIDGHALRVDDSSPAHQRLLADNRLRAIAIALLEYSLQELKDMNDD